jgi:hypothetical protein
MADVPSQSHSSTSVEAAEHLDPRRARSQEQWVYETLRCGGKSDWELWDLIVEQDLTPHPFDQLSSMHRARVGLVWVSRSIEATIWHPVEDSGLRNVNPVSGKETKIWHFKERYREMSYAEWVRDYRTLARGKIEDLYYELYDFPK